MGRKTLFVTALKVCSSGGIGRIVFYIRLDNGYWPKTITKLYITLRKDLMLQITNYSGHSANLLSARLMSDCHSEPVKLSE